MSTGKGNTGLDLDREIAELRGDEWVFGAHSEACLFAVPQDKRELYLPYGELQNIGEEKSGCVSRAYINALEMKFTYAYEKNLVSKSNREWLEQNGYVENGRVVFADANIEILSGTTRKGVSLKAPVDAIRKHGLVPKKMLSQLEKWDDHYNPARLTPAVTNLGLEFARRFSLNYEMVYTRDMKLMLEDDCAGIAVYAWANPINGEYQRVDFPFNHCVLAYALPTTYIFDNYLDQGKQGDFIKKLASNYTIFDHGYRVYVSAQAKDEVVEKEKETKDEQVSKQQILSLFAWFYKLLEWLFEKKGTMPEMPKDIITKPMTVPIKEKTNGEKLFECAESFLGRDASPTDIAPDELGCAETMNEIHKKAFGDYITAKNHLSTYWMYRDLKERKDFIRTNSPLPGDVVISPTGYGTRTDRVSNGHVGVVGKGESIMSNDSKTGKFVYNYTIDSWTDRYTRLGGYPVYFYRKV
jgi:hypothetical protein